jgi:NADH dehydrogenase/NADH:ubiquinone oxidoreductase subunit G
MPLKKLAAAFVAMPKHDEIRQSGFQDGEKRIMEANQKIVKIIMDEKELVVPEGITILEAAQRNNIPIPTLCHHPALSNWGGCRMCVVEVDGSPKLAASCVMPVREGMEVVTTNERILESRRTILEFLFAERNHNCMFCPQSGDCELQALAYELGMDHLTMSFSFNSFPTDVTSEYMTIDHNRCILCGRCVRACAEIAGAHVLSFHNRGPRNLVGLDLHASREESTCYACGVCLQVCPTGAITNRYRTHYAVKGHPKDWQTKASLCTECGLLCPTLSRVHDQTVIKVDGKLGSDQGRPDHGQLCYKGRFEVLKNEGKRLVQPMVKGADGTWREESWDRALALVAERLKAIRRAEGGKALFGLASSALSNEELLQFRDLMAKGCSAGQVGSLDGRHFTAVSKAWELKGEPLKEASWKMIPEADFILLLGAHPYRTQPIISTLVRKAILERGVPVALAGDMDHLPPFAAYQFPVKDEKLPLFIQAFRAEAAAAGKKISQKSKGPSQNRVRAEALSALLKEAGLPKGAKRAFQEMVSAFVRSTHPLILVGDAVTGLKSPSAFQDAVKLAVSKGLDSGNVLRLMVLKPYGNSVGAWKLGLTSNGASKAEDSWKGGLLCLGHPKDLDSSPVADLGHLDFLGVISPYFPESLAERCHVILPKPLRLESRGTYTSVDGWETGFAEKVLDPPEGVKDSWETLSILADQIGFRQKSKTWEDLSQKAQKAIKSWKPVKPAK